MNQGTGFLNSLPLVTRNLIIINTLVFLVQYVLLIKGIEAADYLGLHYFSSELFMPHQLITYMFTHGGWMHLFFNMFAVFMFGRTIETVWGPKRFLTYYMITGIGAGLVQLFVTYLRIQSVEPLLSADQLSEVYSNGLALLEDRKNYVNSTMASFNILINTGTVGASGAVYGILLAFGMLFPNAELIMIPIPVPIKAKYFVIIFGVLALYLGFSNNPNDNVAHFAHLGGLLFGLVVILYWKKRNKINGRFY